MSIKYTVNEMQAEIVRENGSTVLRINGNDFCYAAFRSFRPSSDNVVDFSQSGYRIFCIHSSGIMTALANRTIPYSEFGPVWTGDNEYDWSNLEKQVNMFKENSPNGYYAALIDLNTPDWMLADNPEMCDTWSELIQDVTNPVWIESAKKYIEAYVKKIDELLPGRVFGIYLLAGGTTEWYTRDFVDAINHPSKNHIKSFGGNVPGYGAFCGSDDGILRNFQKDKASYKYLKYNNEAVPKIICEFAKTAKECCSRKKTVGVFFGYVVSEQTELIKLNSNESQMVFDCPDIDIIISPASYDLRKLKSTSGMRVPVDSLSLAGKLYIHEIDSATHLTHNNKFAKLHGVPDDCMENLQQTTAYLRREIGMVLAKGHGYWLFDMFGGWYKDAGTMYELKRLRELSEELMAKNCESVSEIAFMLDLESNYYIDAESDYPMFQFQVEELNKSGMPWDCYLTTDLLKENFNFDRYKLYICPDLFKYNEEILKRIDFLRSKGKSVLFMHAPGYITDKGFSTETMQRLVNMRIKRCDFESAQMTLDVSGISHQTLDFSHRINEWRVKDPAQKRVKFNMPPVFEIDEECEVWGRFVKNGHCGFGIKYRENGGFDAYCAAAPISAELLAKLAERAGVFSYCDVGTTLYANSSLMVVYSYEGGKINLRTKKPSLLREYFTGKEYKTDENGTEVLLKPIETMIFLKDK